MDKVVEKFTQEGFNVDYIYREKYFNKWQLCLDRSEINYCVDKIEKISQELGFVSFRIDTTYPMEINIYFEYNGSE